MKLNVSIPKGVSRPSDWHARQSWLDAQRPVYVPHPEPEVRARVAQPDEIPLAAKRITKTALAAGWLVNTYYARGTALTAKGTPGKVVESCVVALSREVDARHAVASWLDGAFDSALVGRRGELARRVGARELKAEIEQPVDAAAREAA